MTRVWIFPVPVARIDDFRRPRPPSGRLAIQRAASLENCRAVSGACALRRDQNGRTMCERCGERWSVTHTGAVVMVARSSHAVGLDAEVPRSRPAAFRWLARITGTTVITIGQWTQAEAVWKAGGTADRRPQRGELSLPRIFAAGWNQSVDGNWQVFSADEPSLVWSCAVPTASNLRMSVTDLRSECPSASLAAT